jgi:hypothetical protein
MDRRNPIYFQTESKEHPLVRGRYALSTAPIDEFFEQLCVWLDSHVPGAYVYGYSRFGKTWAIQFWIRQLLAERYHGLLPLFILICKQHDRFSESLLLMELLGASKHKYGKSISKKVMLDRLVRLFATRALNSGGNQIVLIIDEAQRLHEPEFQTLCNLQNELDSLGFKLTVISVGSHELTYQHELLIQTGSIHLMARFMVRSARFRGIGDEKELKLVLDGYDLHTDWPSGSHTTYTQYFFPHAFENGFRIADSAKDLWNIFLELGPKKRDYTLEVPMESIAKTVESVFRSYADDSLSAHGLSPGDLVQHVDDSGYQNHMKAVSRMLLDSKGKIQ